LGFMSAYAKASGQADLPLTTLSGDPNRDPAQPPGTPSQKATTLQMPSNDQNSNSSVYDFVSPQVADVDQNAVFIGEIADRAASKRADAPINRKMASEP
jgi:hypothetical protein